MRWQFQPIYLWIDSGYAKSLKGGKVKSYIAKFWSNQFQCHQLCIFNAYNLLKNFIRSYIIISAI